MKKQLKLKPKVEKHLTRISLIGLLITGGFVEEALVVAFIGLLIFLVPCYLLYRYGSDIV